MQNIASGVATTRLITNRNYRVVAGWTEISSSSSYSWRVRHVILFLDPQDEFNPLNAELNPICHLLALLGAHHILHVSRIRVKYKTTKYKKVYL